MSSTRTAHMIRAAVAVALGLVVTGGALLVGERAELNPETFATVIWIAVAAWVAGLVVVLYSVVSSTRGLLLLGREKYVRLLVVVLVAGLGGWLGWQAGLLAREWLEALESPCLAIADLGPFCPGEIIRELAPLFSSIAVGGLAWTIAASWR